MGFKERFRERKERLQQGVRKVWQRTRRYVRFGVYITPAAEAHDSKGHGAHVPHSSHDEHVTREHNDKPDHGVQEAVTHELHPTSLPERVREYDVLKQFLPQRPKISYPASGVDISLSEAFPESEIYYIDTDPHVVDSLTKAKNEKKLPIGTHIIGESALKFTPGALDLVVMRNASITGKSENDSRVFTKYLNPGGIVLAQAWGNALSAKELLGVPSMHLAGKLVHSENKVTLDRSNLEQLAQELRSDNDLDSRFAGVSFIFQKIPQDAQVAPRRAA